MRIGTVVAESNGAKIVSCGIYGYAVADANGCDVDSFGDDDSAMACLLVVASGIAWKRGEA